MSTLNHMVVFRAAMLAPGSTGDKARTRHEDHALRKAPKSKEKRPVQAHDAVSRVYILVAAGTLACAVTAGVVAVTSII